ncbi:Aminopeptidase N [Flavobacterium sp. 9R]|uniref:M1 family metallopeptidase n=1 Tax=Flavobacterium sp. 9R TaxID=2653143 RepID=UPI0012EFF46E|nr:M1 family metallopeptidase [Flavobacterium sp. 9R]VXB93518.1 Aminopeptidase N [Flavobacterium sp. 9R]
MKYIFLFLTSFIFAQQTQSVDFKTAKVQLFVNPKDKTISGTVTYHFNVLRPIDTIKIDAQNMQFTNVKLNDKPVSFVTNGKQLLLIYPFKKGKKWVQFSYDAKPKQTLYFIGSEENANLQIWTQGQGKYTSNWFPSFDDVNEKVVFNLEIVFDKNYQVIANGTLKEKITNGNNTYWRYRMQKPMSSYLLMMAIGRFDKKTQQSNSGVPLEWYYEPKDAVFFEPTYRHSEAIFNFLEKEIGVKYPWENYKQVPVRDFLYAGMENTSATTFSSRYVVDAVGFNDRKYTNVNAHELAHQWFGDLVTAESSKHHWLQEGFATYYALLAERELYGEDYFYSYLYEKAQQLKFASRTDTIPVLNAKASSLTFYEKGAWALFVLHQKIGDKAFKKAIKNYLKKHAFQTVNTNDFFAEIEKVAAFDTKLFSKVWLEDYKFNALEANDLLKKNTVIKIQLKLDQYRNTPFAEKKDFLMKVLQSDVYYTVKESVIFQLRKESYEDIKELLAVAMATKNWSIRQKIANLFSKVPEAFKADYETLLTDASYQTQEIALFQLWNSFENDRIRYLDQTKNWIGFNDYNLRILWLALALNTPNYNADTAAMSKELIQYSSLDFEASTRQNALESLIYLDLFNTTIWKNLANATTHHLWQFSKFARDAIRKQIKQENKRKALQEVALNLPPKEREIINRLLNE